MSIRSIGQYLEQVREGELESSGVFTLDWAKAQEKLGKYQSEIPGLWLFKALQAAVSSGAPRLFVEQSSSMTRAWFEPKDVDGLLDALRTLDPAKERRLHHFQTALQALCSIAQAPAHSVFLGGFRFKAENGVLGERSRLELPPNRFGYERTYPKGGWFGNRGTQVDEAMFLQEIGRFAPIPIYVDGRLLNDPMVNKPPGLRLGVGIAPLITRPRPALPPTTLERVVLTQAALPERLCVCDPASRNCAFFLTRQGVISGLGKQVTYQEWVDEDGVPMCESIADCNLLRTQLRAPYRYFDSKIERSDQDVQIWPDYNRGLTALTVRGYLASDLYKRGPGRVYFVKDGVAMKPIDLGIEFQGCLALWSAPEVNTDLSQLQVLRDDVAERELEKVRRHYRQAAKHALDLESNAPQFTFFGLFGTDFRPLRRWGKQILLLS